MCYNRKRRRRCQQYGSTECIESCIDIFCSFERQLAPIFITLCCYGFFLSFFSSRFFSSLRVSSVVLCCGMVFSIQVCSFLLFLSPVLLCSAVLRWLCLICTFLLFCSSVISAALYCALFWRGVFCSICSFLLFCSICSFLFFCSVQ